MAEIWNGAFPAIKRSGLVSTARGVTAVVIFLLNGAISAQAGQIEVQFGGFGSPNFELHPSAGSSSEIPAAACGFRLQNPSGPWTGGWHFAEPTSGDIMPGLSNLDFDEEPDFIQVTGPLQPGCPDNLHFFVTPVADVIGSQEAPLGAQYFVADYDETGIIWLDGQHEVMPNPVVIYEPIDLPSLCEWFPDLCKPDPDIPEGFDLTLIHPCVLDPDSCFPTTGTRALDAFTAVAVLAGVAAERVNAARRLWRDTNAGENNQEISILRAIDQATAAVVQVTQGDTALAGHVDELSGNSGAARYSDALQGAARTATVRATAARLDASTCEKALNAARDAVSSGQGREELYEAAGTCNEFQATANEAFAALASFRAHSLVGRALAAPRGEKDGAAADDYPADTPGVFVLQFKSEVDTSLTTGVVLINEDVSSRVLSSDFLEARNTRPTAVDCVTAGCVGFQEMCLAGNNFFVYWDENGDDIADAWDCEATGD